MPSSRTSSSLPRSSTQAAAASIKPRALSLELTKGCNLRCPYCYYAGRDDAYDPKDRMSLETARQSVDLLMKEGPTDQPVHLHFFGGEPLLNFDLLRKTTQYAVERAKAVGKSVTFEVTTNGTRFTDEIIEFLNQHAMRIGVSFDGPKDVQDVARPAFGGSSYDRAVPGIQKLLVSRQGTSLESETHVSVVVTRRDIDLFGIANHLEELGFRHIIMTPATDLEGGGEGIRSEDLPQVLEAYDRLAEDCQQRMARGESVSVKWFPLLMGRLLSGERREHFCQGGRDYLGVAADGSLGLCYRFYENEDFQMGDVRSGVDRAVTERLLDLPLEKKTDCASCWARYFCGGGCHHDNLISGGGLDKPNPITCDILRHSMSRTLGMWAELSSQGVVGAPASNHAVSEESAMENEVFADDWKPVRSQGCHLREVGREVVVYEPKSHEVAVLNPTATLIFEKCDGTHSVADLLQYMIRQFDAPSDVLSADLQETLRHLKSRSIVD